MEDFTAVYTHIPMSDESVLCNFTEWLVFLELQHKSLLKISVLLPCITFAALNSSKAQL